MGRPEKGLRGGAYNFVASLQLCSGIMSKKPKVEFKSHLFSDERAHAIIYFESKIGKSGIVQTTNICLVPTSGKTDTLLAWRSKILFKSTGLEDMLALL